jgi:hypothetical protein
MRRVDACGLGGALLCLALGCENSHTGMPQFQSMTLEVRVTTDSIDPRYSEKVRDLTTQALSRAAPRVAVVDRSPLRLVVLFKERDAPSQGYRYAALSMDLVRAETDAYGKHDRVYWREMVVGGEAAANYDSYLRDMIQKAANVFGKEWRIENELKRGNTAG